MEEYISLMNINFTALRAFYEVARCNSFTLAADHLCLTQPAVSKAVSGLEDVLGISLFERTSRQVRLTEAGQGLWDHARSIFAMEQAAMDEIVQRRGLRRGKLHIGASTTIASFWLVQELARYLQCYPDIDVHVSAGNTQSMVQRVLDGEVEMALVEGGVIEEPRLDCHWWRNEPLLLVAAPTYPVQYHDLNCSRWVMREQGSGTAQVVHDYLERAGIFPQARVVVESNQAVVEMVVAGAGIAIVPLVLARHYQERGELVPLPWPLYPLERPLTKISLRGRQPSPAREAFEALLVS